MRYFKELEKIRDASVEELAQVDTMNERAAKQVYEFFHNNRQSSAFLLFSPIPGISSKIDLTCVLLRNDLWYSIAKRCTSS